MIQPIERLQHHERAQLHALVTMEGYVLLHRIMRAEVDKFIIALINADAADERDVIARHKLAKASAQFYEALTQRVNEEVMQYTQATRETDVPVDMTEGVIDIGEAVQYLPPNLLGGGEDFDFE